MRGAVLALAIGALAGLVTYLIRMPLPWMLGSMIGTTIAAMAHLPIKGPDRLRPLVIPIIGVMLGSGMSPDLFSQLGNWLLTVALLIPFLIIAAGLSFSIYRRVGGYDPVTAFYAAIPGGLNEMLLLGAAAGGNEKRIALAHASRVLIVIVFVALFFGLVLGVTTAGRGGNWTALSVPSWQDYGVLAACAIVGAWLARLVGLPAGPVFGPMILSGVAHIAGFVTVAPPTLFTIAAQIVIGTVIGSRFIGARPAEILRDIGLAALATGTMIIVAVVFACGVSWASGMALSQSFLAYAPGGLTEMTLLTFAMHQDVTYVSVMHLLRITIVVSLAPVAFRAMRRWQA